MVRIYKAGEIYSFKTSPFYKFGEQDTGRYACLKILDPETTIDQPKDTLVTYVVLDGIYDRPPHLEKIVDAIPLVRKRFMFGQLTPFERMSKNPPKKFATGSARLDWEPDLLEFSLVGSSPISDSEHLLGEKNSSYSAWRSASSDAEGEWRWRNDNERLLIEHDLKRKRMNAGSS